MITLEGIDDIVVNGGVVVTRDGAKLGSVEQVFLSEDSGEPAFVTVRTGLFGMLESFVPLDGATIDGPRVVVAFDRDRIRNGPRIESDRGSITADEEKELYDYYGTSAPQAAGSAESAGSVETAEQAVPVESAALPADAAGRPEPQVQSPGAPPTPEHPHPHPHDAPHPP
ncbi:PRC-barrel domain-containing protein, partial [Cryobacterium sp. 10I5]|uniref:PRC-barrel domain-containing protein n=1 Tax=Cryobacterium sp. 10I5 TaxID=3048581 RepID=UPI002B236946